MSSKPILGIIAIGYDCPDVISTLAPWVLSKCGAPNEHTGIQDVAPNPLFDLKIVCVSALFKENRELGRVYAPNNACSETLRRYEASRAIDKFIEIDAPILDFEARNAGLDYLRQFNPDFIFQLDLFDEYYTLAQIHTICEFLHEHPWYDFYRINFRNYFGHIKDRTYVQDFRPVRILNNKNHGGVTRFYWDNDVTFADKTQTPNCAGTQIPYYMCNPCHLSWTHDDSVESKIRIKDKIAYQWRAIGTCSYRWNVERDTAEFNLAYYNRRGQSLPEIFHAQD
jgi:hypothetical protein